jgi:hypothetical protein
MLINPLFGVFPMWDEFYAYKRLCYTKTMLFSAESDLFVSLNKGHDNEVDQPKEFVFPIIILLLYVGTISLIHICMCT